MSNLINCQNRWKYPNRHLTKSGQRARNIFRVTEFDNLTIDWSKYFNEHVLSFLRCRIRLTFQNAFIPPFPQATPSQNPTTFFGSLSLILHLFCNILFIRNTEEYLCAKDEHCSPSSLGAMACKSWKRMIFCVFSILHRYPPTFHFLPPSFIEVHETRFWKVRS